MTVSTMSAPKKWLILFAAMLPQMFIWGILLFAFPLWSVPWIKTYSASHSQIMATSMCMLFGIGWLSPLGGYMAEKINVRNLIAVGVIVNSLTFLLLARATAMWQVTLLYALPLAAGLVLTSQMMGQILAVNLFRPKSGLAIGVVSMGAAIGGIISPFVINKLLSAHSWQTAFVIFAIAGMALLPVVLLLIPKLSRSLESEQKQMPATVRISAMAIMTDRTFICTSIMIVFILNLLFNAVFYNLGPYMQDIGGNVASTAKIVSVSAVTGAFGMVAFAALADRFDYRLILLLAVILVGFGVAAAGSGANVEETLLTLPTMAVTAGGVVSLVPVIMAQRFGRDNFARATGLSLPFSFLGSIGPFIAGFGRDKLGSYPHTFAAMLGLILIPILGLLLLATMRNSKPALAGELQKGF
ncbi:MAG TPA: MFS transporter [Bradyrhizobium sp.]|nr:MFS transporter [Bradyrhizobium sp.]